MKMCARCHEITHDLFGHYAAFLGTPERRVLTNCVRSELRRRWMLSVVRESLA